MKEEPEYSRNEFDGFTYRFVVEFETGEEYSTTLHIYSNSDSYDDLNNFIEKHKSEKILGYKIHHRASKEQDEKINEFFENF